MQIFNEKRSTLFVNVLVFDIRDLERKQVNLLAARLYDTCGI